MPRPPGTVSSPTHEAIVATGRSAIRRGGIEDAAIRRRSERSSAASSCDGRRTRPPSESPRDDLTPLAKASASSLETQAKLETLLGERRCRRVVEQVRRERAEARFAWAWGSFSSVDQELTMSPAPRGPDRARGAR